MSIVGDLYEEGITKELEGALTDAADIGSPAVARYALNSIVPLWVRYRGYRLRGVYEGQPPIKEPLYDRLLALAESVPKVNE
jgi:hypothetical protein